MHSSNTLLPSKRINRLFIIIAITVTVTLSAFVIIKPSSPFYSIDPDVPYVANSLKMVAINQTSYINHPGTPLQSFIAFTYWPLRVWAKLIAQQPFILWSLSNFEFLFWYTRLVMAILFLCSLYLSLVAWFISSKSIFSALAGLSFLFLMPHFSLSPLSINAESFIFPLMSIWTLNFAVLLIKQSKALFYSLLFITGVLLSTKLTSVFIVPISLGIVFYFYFRSLKGLLFMLVSCTSSLITGFVWGTWPIRDRYPQFFSWAFSLFSHSGLYGGGKKTIFSADDYLRVAKVMIMSNKLLVIMPILIGIFIILSKSRYKGLIIWMYVVSLMGIIVFLKYPIWYYQMPNILIMALLLSIVTRNLKREIVIGIIVLVVFGAFPLMRESLMNARAMATESSIIDNFVMKNSVSGPTVWEYGRSKQFALLWGRDWSGDFYWNELSTIYPELYDVQNHVVVKYPSTQLKNINALCWKRMYIQNASYPDFIKFNPKYRNLIVQRIDATMMMYVDNSECPSNKK
jgi:hypothetical protein